MDMRKILGIWVLLSLFLVASGLTAGTTITSVKTEPEVIAAGETVTVTVKFDAEGEGEVGAYSIWTYGDNVPKGVAEKVSNMQGWTFKETKDNYKGGSYFITPADPGKNYSYIDTRGAPIYLKERLKGKDQSISFTLNTADWVEGDYLLFAVTVTFPPTGNCIETSAEFVISVKPK